MAEKGRIITGARSRFSLNGRKVGFARNVGLGENINYEGIVVLDSIQVIEFVPIGYEVEFTASQFRIINETLKSLGYFPSVGANAEEHLENILISGDLSATLEDSKTGKLFATVEQVKIAGHNFQIDARGVVGEDITFNAIRVRDESEI